MSGRDPDDNIAREPLNRAQQLTPRRWRGIGFCQLTPLSSALKASMVKSYIRITRYRDMMEYDVMKQSSISFPSLKLKSILEFLALT